MIADTSVILSILRDEPGARQFVRQMEESGQAIRLSAASYVEIGAVIDSARDPIASRRVDEVLHELRVRIEAVSSTQATIAREAYRDFGKGSGHPAGLNFGDCFSYALAKELGEPLLYKGEDFVHTDIAQVADPS